jgi:hypothetical protein
MSRSTRALLLGVAMACAPLAPAVAAPAAAPQKPAAAPAPAEGAKAGEGITDFDKLLDQALERFYGKKHNEAAGMLYALMRSLPETDLRRDTVGFYLAVSLSTLGFSQAAVEKYLDVAIARRAPELVGRALGAIDELTRHRKMDEDRLIDEILFGNQYGDLPQDTADFVQYYQAVGELRRGYTEWGSKDLDQLGRANRYYGWKARHALAVERIVQGNEDGADKLLLEVINSNEAPNDVRNDARLALARMRYEKKRFDEAFQLYAAVDYPLPLQDAVMQEKAWDRILAEDEQRALGLVISLGAPVFNRLFTPERDLISAVAEKRLCQFRAAHLAVLDFREHYGPLVAKIRERLPIADEPIIKHALLGRDDLVPERRTQRLLEEERARLSTIGDKELREHLQTVYGSRLAKSDAQVARRVKRATDAISEELLRIDEQLTILDYEIGVGLFKAAGDLGPTKRVVHRKIPLGGDVTYQRFSGEYWSDELPDLAVFADDRCVR